MSAQALSRICRLDSRIRVLFHILLTAIMGLTLLVSSCKKEDKEQDQCNNCTKYDNVNYWQISVTESDEKNVSYKGGHIILNHEKMSYEKCFHGYITTPGWPGSGGSEDWEVIRKGKFTFNTDSLHIIFKDDIVNSEPDTGFITPAHWIYPVNSDSVYNPEEIQVHFWFEHSFFSVSGNFIYEKEE